MKSTDNLFCLHQYVIRYFNPYLFRRLKVDGQKNLRRLNWKIAGFCSLMYMPCRPGRLPPHLKRVAPKGYQDRLVQG